MFRVYIPSARRNRKGMATRLLCTVTFVQIIHDIKCSWWTHDIVYHSANFLFPTGQFWNIDVSIEKFTGTLRHDAPTDNVYNITVTPPEGGQRSFPAWQEVKVGWVCCVTTCTCCCDYSEWQGLPPTSCTIYVMSCNRFGGGEPENQHVYHYWYSTSNGVYRKYLHVLSGHMTCHSPLADVGQSQGLLLCRQPERWHCVWASFWTRLFHWGRLPWICDWWTVQHRL